MRLKKNVIFDATVTDITNLGFGVTRHGGEVVFVADAVPGDVVSVRVIKVASSYAVGRVERYIRRSNERVEGRCQIGACKSCAYKALSYEYELGLKRELVVNSFKKCGLGNVEVGDTVGSPSTSCYRNKAQYPVTRSANGEYMIGFYAPKSHRVTEAAKCPLAPTAFGEILDTCRAFFKKHDLSTYNEADGTGLLRHIYLRRGELSGEVLLTIVINGGTLPYADELVARVTAAHPDVVGILTNENTADTNVVLGEKFTTLYGRDHIFDTLAGVRLKITAPSFYQVNHDATELLYAKARELAELSGDELLLDLYCGAGSIGLSMANDCREVIGIEIVDSAVECAKYNAAENGIKNASFYTGDAANTEGLLANAERIRGEKIRPDAVILDPPRGGSDEGLLRYIANTLSPSRVVYISCNPATLARDAAILAPLGYEIGKVTPFDLFPGTGHVESVVCLKRQIQQ